MDKYLYGSMRGKLDKFNDPAVPSQCADDLIVI
jgi:hypothetical protein